MSYDWSPDKSPALPESYADLLKRKRDYVDKYGYRIPLPGFDEVFDYTFDNPPTEEEEKQWKRKGHGDLTDERIAEIEGIKEMRKQAYLNILGSPNLPLQEARASLINAIDDLQDGVFTAAAIATISSLVTSGALSAGLKKGGGWGMTAAGALDILTGLIAPEWKLLKPKRHMDNATKDNPNNKKGKVKKKARKLPKGFWPSFVIQGLQTTRELFGVGLALGPVVSLPEKAIMGLYRYADGSPVTIVAPGGREWTFQLDSYNAAEAFALLSQFPHQTDDDFIGKMWIQVNAQYQIANAVHNESDILGQIPDISNIVCEARGVRSEISKEILQEVDPAAINKIGWPINGKKVNNLMDMTERSKDIATDNFRRWSERQKNSVVGLAIATNASNAAMHMLEMIGGQGSVEYDYTAWTKAYHTMLEFGYYPPADLTQGQKDCLTRWLEDHEAHDTAPSTPEIVSHCKNVCGFELIKQW